MLLDLLAGWVETINPAREDAEAGFRAWRRGRAGDTNREAYEAYRRHYSQAYQDRAMQLYQLAGELAWTDEDDPNRLTPRQFLEQHVLPLFDEPPQDQP